MRSPRLYVRVSGILHALLGIADKEALLSHPAVGASWETWGIDNLLTAAGPVVQAYCNRTAVGAKVDLLLTLPDNQRWAVEIKRSLSPKLDRAFHSACADLQPQQRWLMYPGQDRWRMAGDVQVLPLRDMMAALLASNPGFEFARAAACGAAPRCCACAAPVRSRPYASFATFAAWASPQQVAAHPASRGQAAPR